MALLLMILLNFCLCCLPMVSWSLSFTEVPTDQAITVGSEANFSCEIDVLGNDQKIAWYFGQDSQISLGDEIVGEQPENAQILVNGRRYTLRIPMARIIDSRQYHCAVLKLSSMTVELRSREANLMVYFLPGPNDPACEGGRTIHAGESANIRCDSTKGNPPVALAWTRSDGKTIDHSTDVEHMINSDLRTEIVYKFEIQRDDSNVTFTCTSTSPAFFPDYRETCNLTFNVLYPPDEPIIRAPETGKLVCQYNGNPQPNVSWSVEGSSNFTVVILEDVLTWNTSQTCNNVTLATCTVRNSIGQMTNQQILCDPREQEATTTSVTVEETRQKVSAGFTEEETAGEVTQEEGVTTESTSPRQPNLILVILSASAACTVLVILVFVVVAMVIYKTRHTKRDKDSENESNSGGTSSRGSICSSNGEGNEEDGEDNVGYTTSVPEYPECNERVDPTDRNSNPDYLYIANEAKNFNEMRHPDDGDDYDSTDAATNNEGQATGPINSEEEPEVQ